LFKEIKKEVYRGTYLKDLLVKITNKNLDRYIRLYIRSIYGTKTQ
jgi:hypothetical protein